MKLYQYPKCSTCRKATKFLNKRAVDFESIDITITPPSEAELQVMFDSYQGELRKLFNTSGVQYRELNMKEKLPTMKVNDAIELLAGNGKLIKRPFILNDNNKGLVGFNEENWKEFLNI